MTERADGVPGSVRGANSTSLSGVAACLLAGLLVLATAVLVLVPNYVYADTASGDEIFFSCGSAISPDVVPPEEPGLSRCSAISEKQARAGIVTLVGAAILFGIGIPLIVRRYRRARTPR
ncbi:hypothetical protein [Nocardioides gilvus]|uniref:hypothetical protein n=1 Tax=Nocardioides gilvus TaxID=1735589 RepID=UPI0013A56867|nr:hypothetical protein [Nocardioides gilvus]